MRKLVAFAVLGSLAITYEDWAQASGAVHVGGVHVGGMHVGSMHIGGAHVGHIGAVHVGGAHLTGGHYVSHIGGIHVNHPGYYHPSYYHSSYYHPSYVHHTAHLYPSFTGGTGFYSPGYGNSYGLYGYGYGSGYNYGYNNAYVNGTTYPANLNYAYRTYAPEATGIAPAPTALNNNAALQVLVPTADTEIQLGNDKTTSVGRERVFRTPALEPGFRYSYTVKASWIQDGRSMNDIRTVNVVAGRVSLVDFTHPAGPELVVPPTKIGPN